MNRFLRYPLLCGLLIILLSLFFAIHPAGAQTKTRPGYMITLQGDTLKGSIALTGLGFAPKKIEFISEKGEPAEISPATVSGYAIPPDAVYESRHVPMDLSPYKIEDITSAKPYWNKEDTLVFLRQRVLGRVSLYSITDMNGKQHYYISKDGSALKELVISRTPNVRTFNGVSHMAIAEVEIYKGLLTTLFSDCPDVARKIGNIDLTVQDLSKIVKEYNSKCQR